MSTHWRLRQLHQLIRVSCLFLQGGVAEFGWPDLSSGGSPPGLCASPRPSSSPMFGGDSFRLVDHLLFVFQDQNLAAAIGEIIPSRADARECRQEVLAGKS